jgi:hypothetical protein
MYRLLKDVFGWFLGCDSGHFHLNHGDHELFVPTKIQAKEVWVRCIGKGHDGCGQCPQNWVCYDLHKGGISFYIEVNTQKCKVEWFAIS